MNIEDLKKQLIADYEQNEKGKTSALEIDGQRETHLEEIKESIIESNLNDGSVFGQLVSETIATVGAKPLESIGHGIETTKESLKKQILENQLIQDEEKSRERSNYVERSPIKIPTKNQEREMDM